MEPPGDDPSTARWPLRSISSRIYGKELGVAKHRDAHTRTGRWSLSPIRGNTLEGVGARGDIGEVELCDPTIESQAGSTGDMVSDAVATQLKRDDLIGESPVAVASSTAPSWRVTPLVGTITDVVRGTLAIVIETGALVPVSPCESVATLRIV